MFALVESLREGQPDPCAKVTWTLIARIFV